MDHKSSFLLNLDLKQNLLLVCMCACACVHGGGAHLSRTDMEVRGQSVQQLFPSTFMWVPGKNPGPGLAEEAL